MTTATPKRPLGVYMVTPTGDTLPVQLAYAGYQEEIHLWDCITPLLPGAQLRVSYFPSQTAIRMPTEC